MKTNGNEPIHPASLCEGLTKREYFAAMALNGILSSRGLQGALNLGRTNWQEEAVNQADALIEALNKEATHE